MSTSLLALRLLGAGTKSEPSIAPPCAQPLDGLHKTLYVAFLIVVAALVYEINQPPLESSAAPAACSASTAK